MLNHFSQQNHTIEVVLILGGHIQALGLARQAKIMSCHVIVCSRDSWSVARFSKNVDEFVIKKTNCEIVDFIKEINSSSCYKNTIVVPTSDDYIELITQQKDTLTKLVFLLPEKTIVSTFQNKRLSYKFIEKLRKDNPNICQPLSYCLDAYEQLLTLADTIQYPIVLKPAVMYDFHNRLGKKAFLCINKEDLLQKMQQVLYAGVDVKDVILQEFLTGGPNNLYSVGAFAVDGKIISSITAHRIRQNPMDFGNSTTYAITCELPELYSHAKYILEKTNYSGLAEIEFMYDEKVGCHKFLEINTRSWKWHTLSEACGFGFMSDVIKWFNGERFRHESRSGVAWVERLTDWTVILKSCLQRKMSLRDVLQSYNYTKQYAVWSWKDPIPGLMYIIMSPILYFKRY